LSFHIISPAIDIAIIAIVLAVLSMAIQIKFLDWKKTRRMQKSVQEKNKKVMELMKKGDEHSKKEAEELQRQLMQEMSEQFKNLPKQMIISLVIFLPAFALIRYLYEGAGALLTLPIDFTLDAVIFKTNLATWGWFKWYALCGFVASIVLTTVLGKLEEKGKI